MSDSDPVGLGKSAPVPKIYKSPTSHKLIGVTPELLEEFKEKVRISMEDCASRREVLEVEVDTLAECASLAAEIFKQSPVPDNAYQLTALTSAHNTAINQLEKLKDPTLVLGDLERLIRKMLVEVVQTLALEINKAKVDFTNLYPKDALTINEVFSRMLDAIQPQTSAMYDELHKSLKGILGLKK